MLADAQHIAMATVANVDALVVGTSGTSLTCLGFMGTIV